MTKSMYLLIKDAQNKNDEAFLAIWDKFKYTIKKFSIQLEYCGYYEAETDLIIELIIIIRKINLDKFRKKGDGALINFIYNSLKNKKISLFNKSKQQISEIELDTDIISAANNISIEDKILIKNLLNQLTKLQKTVIVKKFIYDYSEFEIANELHISRQAVNKAKNRGLKRLRKYIVEQNIEFQF